MKLQQFLKNKRIRLSILLFLVIILVGGGLFVGISFYQDAQWGDIEIAEYTLRFSVPVDFQIQTEPEKVDERLTVLFRAQEGELLQPLFVSLRSETGMRIVTSLSHQDLMPMLLSNSNKAFPLRFPEYKKLSEKEFEVSGKDAAELIFTYQGPTEETVRQRLWMIAYDGNTVLYFAVNAKNTDFDALNKKYFDRVLSSLSFQ